MNRQNRERSARIREKTVKLCRYVNVHHISGLNHAVPWYAVSDLIV
jgi:hypothetical protein